MSTKQQTIFRANHSKQNPYFQMLRTTAQDQSLSFESRGVIAYLLSKPNHWEINKSDLMKQGGLGRTKMTRIIDELTTARYLTFTQEHDDTGKFTRVVYTLYEDPQPEAQNVTADDTPLSQNATPAQEKEPLSQKPQADNDHQDNKDIEDTTGNAKPEDNKEDAPTAQETSDPEVTPFKHIQTIFIDAWFGSDWANAGWAGKLTHMVMGTSEANGFKEYNFDPPFDPDTMLDWAGWLVQQGITLPTSPEKLLRWKSKYLAREDDPNELPRSHVAEYPPPTLQDRMDKAARINELYQAGQVEDAMNYTFADLYREREEQARAAVA
jgi:DNA-binding MarR family transcriptional regulator